MQSKQRLVEEAKPPPRPWIGTVLALSVVSLLVAPLLADDTLKEARRAQDPAPAVMAASPVAAVQTAREVLARFDKDWRDYTNDPNDGDPRWKLKMETLVGLTRTGRVAVPLLEEAAREDSPWKPHTRDLATEILRILRGPVAVREAIVSYDLSQMDTAHVGKPAPDFALADASGQTYRLSQFRGKKAVVLTFVIQDI